MEFTSISLTRPPGLGFEHGNKFTSALAAAQMVRGSITDEGETLRTYLDRPWGPPSLLYNGCRASFPRRKWTTHPSSAEVKVRLRLHLLPVWSFVACSKANITLHFNIVIIVISRS